MGDLVGILAKIFISFVLVAFLIGVTGFAIGHSQAVNLKTYVEDQINREGGLTPSAQEHITNYVDENYGGKFSVVSNSGNDKKPYGEKTEFTIKGELTMNVLNLPATLVTATGEGTSRIR